MPVFTVTIENRTAAFGERTDQERHASSAALQKVAQNVGSGAPLTTTITDANGEVIGAASWGTAEVNAAGGPT
jgi:hypothetical protein